MGSLNYFLGISVTRDSTGMFLSQRKYATEILERAHMIGCNPSQTPIDTESKLGDDGDPVSDPHYTVVLQVLYSTLPSLDLIFLMLFNKFVFICMILASLIFWLLSGSYGMFGVL